MTPRAKEWIVNGLLLAGIAGLLALMALGNLSGPHLPTGPEEPRVAVPETTPPPANRSQTVYDPRVSRPDLFPNIGKLDIFRDCVTPTPTPAAKTPAPLPTPSLDRVTQNWEYQYSVRRKGIHVFQDTKTKTDYEISETEWKELPDAAVRSSIKVRAKPKSKTEVILEGVPVTGGGTQTRTLGY